MDFQSFVDSVSMQCCVISVEEKPGGGWGDIRIHRANRRYREIMGPAYYDDMPYYELVPRDNKFEDFCYRAAILGQRMHAYVETKALNAWTDQTLIPLAHRDGPIGYCQFIFEFTQTAEADRMATVSAGVSEAVIKSCIALMCASDFEKSVGTVLDELMAFSSANACRIMLVDHEGCRAVNFCERYIAAEDPAFSLRGEDSDDIITYDLICSWEALIGVSNSVIVQSAKDMAALEPLNPEWVRSMRTYNVTSLVLIPLRQGRDIIGYLYVVNFDVARAVEVKELIELLAFFLGSEISNYLLMRRLERMSHTDGLTGLNNRYAMMQRTKALAEAPEPFGIINMDLNGLKQVNDREGHEAGDRLLIRAAAFLRRHFRPADLYRTGGDEFVAIIGGIGRERFEEKVERLRRAVAESDDVSFAVGACWSDGTGDIAAAFREADARMYEDKKAFYCQNPDAWYDRRAGFDRPCCRPDAPGGGA